MIALWEVTRPVQPSTISISIQTIIIFMSVPYSANVAVFKKVVLHWISSSQIEQLKNNAVNYISHIRGAYKNECLWSTFKQYANKFDCPRLKYRCAKRDSRKGNGCLGCQSRDSCRVNFLACNCRATNRFKDKTVLIYLLNIYPSPVISDYLAAKGYPLDADTYALAQLLQWIWRSAIREDKPVYLYLPSSRLRKLLYQYLNDED